MINKILKNSLREVKEQYSTPDKVEYVAPSNSKGTDGDRKVVKLENKFYLYQKIEKAWYRVELERA